MPATLLPSDSISQAPPPRRHHSSHHHHSDRDRRSSGYRSHGPPRSNSDGALLTEENLAVHTSEAIARRNAAQQQLRERERNARDEILLEADDEDEDEEEDDYNRENEREVEEVATLRRSGSARQSTGSRSVAQSKLSSHRSAMRSSRDIVETNMNPTISARETSPNKWVIVEVEEHPDKVVEREYTIERVRRYHYG